MVVRSLVNRTIGLGGGEGGGGGEDLLRFRLFPGGGGGGLVGIFGTFRVGFFIVIASISLSEEDPLEELELELETLVLCVSNRAVLDAIFEPLRIAKLITPAVMYIMCMPSCN